MGTEIYGNYDKKPLVRITDDGSRAANGMQDVTRWILEEKKRREKKGVPITVFLDLYPGVSSEEVRSIAAGLSPDLLVEMEDLALPVSDLTEKMQPFLTDDRVFGVICHWKENELFDPRRLEDARKLLAANTGTAVVIGPFCALLSKPDLWIYFDMTRWEIQLRYRSGMPNWHADNPDAPILAKYKRGFFVEWRIADRYKRAYFSAFDALCDGTIRDHPKLIPCSDASDALHEMSRRPFRTEPYFDPGVWGGHWMQEHFGLDPNEKNFAWSFDGVPEENAINLGFGETVISLPAMDLVMREPENLLGKRVYARFGPEFPIRFDLLDTMGGGNLSLQVHPLTGYIQDEFGMHYTQDESYYLLDTKEGEDTYVYLGLKKGVDPKVMREDLEAAQRGEKDFPTEKYVNRIPVRRGDHVMIPAGTVHCSGKDTMVLEISATPYIFTFKLWDWGRRGLDGLPRPIHIDRGMQNIRFDRDTDFVESELIHQETLLETNEDYTAERTGLHRLEFIDTIRYTVRTTAMVPKNDSVHVMNLVYGSHAVLKSPEDSFPPFEVHFAETVIVPAAAGDVLIEAPKGEQIRMISAFIREDADTTAFRKPDS